VTLLGVSGEILYRDGDFWGDLGSSLHRWGVGKGLGCKFAP
jgi:hypothetical protein